MLITGIRGKFKGFLFAATAISLLALSGCSQGQGQNLAQESSRKAEVYYQQSIKQYQELIRQGRDQEQLILELGKLYYQHGDYNAAIKEFKQTGLKEGKKFLAISFYRMGNFTDALEIFNKNVPEDGESRYYQGLTARL